MVPIEDKAPRRRREPAPSSGRSWDHIEHDLRNMLTVIVNNVDYIGKSLPGPDVLKRVDLIKAAAAQSLAILDDI